MHDFNYITYFFGGNIGFFGGAVGGARAGGAVGGGRAGGGPGGLLAFGFGRAEGGAGLGGWKEVAESLGLDTSLPSCLCSGLGFGKGTSRTTDLLCSPVGEVTTVSGTACGFLVGRGGGRLGLETCWQECMVLCQGWRVLSAAISSKEIVGRPCMTKVWRW